VILRNVPRHKASCGLSATADFLVCSENGTVFVLRKYNIQYDLRNVKFDERFKRLSLLLLLDGEHKEESDMLSLSTSGVCSSIVSAASDSLISQPLNFIDPFKNFYERSPAEQYSLSSANIEAVSEFEPVLSSGLELPEWERLSCVSGDSRGNCEPSLLASSTNNDLLNCDEAVLKMERVETLDTGKEWTMKRQSLAVNCSLHKSDDDSVVDVSSVISDSGVDSSTLSSRLGVSEISSAQRDSSALQPIVTEPNRTLHGRSASESGIFKHSQCFQNLSQHHRKYEEGTE